MDNLEKEANERYNHHVVKQKGYYRPLVANHELIGIRGEDAFAKKYGVERNNALLERGDGGVDFVINNIKIDVKTASRDYGLLVETKKQKDDLVYILAVIDTKNEICFLGWIYGNNVKSFPIQTSRHGVINYVVPSSCLKSMNSFEKLIKGE